MKNEPIRDVFLEKRKARQRKARRKRLILSCIVLIIALLITAVTLCLTVFFPITKINVSGSKIYTSDEIIANSGIKVGDNIFTFNANKATDLLKNKLPYIEKVEFKRNLPDTLNIKVSDAEAYYCFFKDGVYYNVSKSGWVLEKVAHKNEDVFEIKISDVSCTVGTAIAFTDKKSEQRLENIIGFLTENGLKIDYVDITDPVTLKAGVEGRFDVIFGTENSLENKVKRLKVMIQNVADGKTGTMNLSMWNDQNPYGTFVENYTK